MRLPVEMQDWALPVSAGKIGAKWAPVDFDGQINE
jgi:hypothetical protein